MFKYGGIFFMVVGLILLLNGIKGIAEYIEYSIKTEVETAYVTKYTKTKYRMGYQYNVDCFFIDNKDTIKANTSSYFKLYKDTTQYYGELKVRFFPSNGKLLLNKKTHEFSTDGVPFRKLWSHLTPMVISLIFLLIGRVFYRIGKKADEETN